MGRNVLEAEKTYYRIGLAEVWIPLPFLRKLTEKRKFQFH